MFWHFAAHENKYKNIHSRASTFHLLQHKHNAIFQKKKTYFSLQFWVFFFVIWISVLFLFGDYFFLKDDSFMSPKTVLKFLILIPQSHKLKG